MKSEAEIRELLASLHACRFALGQISTAIVAKDPSMHTIWEQRVLHGDGNKAEYQAINLQIALLNHILQ